MHILEYILQILETRRYSRTIIIVFRKDRPDGYGGVFQAIKKDLIVTQRLELDTDCEIIWTQCQLADKKAKSILLGSFYRPNAHDIKSLHELDNSLSALGDKLHRHNVVLAGDFNAPTSYGKTKRSLGIFLPQSCFLKLSTNTTCASL